MLVFCEDCGGRNNIDVNTVRKANNQYRCQNCNFLNLLLIKEEEKPTQTRKITTHPIGTSISITTGSVTACRVPEMRGIVLRSVHPVREQGDNEVGKRACETPDSVPCEQLPRKKRKTPLDRVPYLRIFKEIIPERDILGACIYNRSEGILASNLPEGVTTVSMAAIAQALTFCRTMGSKVLRKTDDTYLVLTSQVITGRDLTKDLTLIICCTSYPLTPRLTAVIDKAINNFHATTTAFWRP